MNQTSVNTMMYTQLVPINKPDQFSMINSFSYNVGNRMLITLFLLCEVVSEANLFHSFLVPSQSHQRNDIAYFQ